MSLKHRFDQDQLEQDLLRRYGLERSPQEELDEELELADRHAEQASLPGSPEARALARRRLGRDPFPYEQPHDPPAPTRMAPGEQVVRLAFRRRAPTGPGGQAPGAREPRRRRLRAQRGDRRRGLRARTRGRMTDDARDLIYEPGHPPTIPSGQTIADWRRTRRRQTRRSPWSPLTERLKRLAPRHRGGAR